MVRFTNNIVAIMYNYKTIYTLCTNENVIILPTIMKNLNIFENQLYAHFK